MNPVRMRAIVWLPLLLAWSSHAFALNPALDITQYAHTAWTIRAGFFTGGVMSIAQTPDGYLWIGTESGLFRFDGVRATPVPLRGPEQLPHATIAKLLVTRDGRLWIGTFAGLASWKDGRLVTYPEFAGDVVAALIEDAEGTVWAGTIAVPNGRLCAIRTTVECAGQDGRLGNGVFSLFADRGTLWVGAMSGLWRWAPGNPTGYATPKSTISDVIKLNDGPLFLATTTGIQQLVGETLEAHALSGVDAPFNAKRLLQDRDGGVWIGSQRRGLIHLHQGRVDLFTSSHGLSGDTVSALYEDREGNVWVGTNEGLDRFRELSVTTVSRTQGLPTDLAVSVLPARDGSVWIGSADGVTRWEGARSTIYRTRDGLPDNRISTLYEDSTGRVLLATLGGMATFDDGQFAPVRSLSFTGVVYNIVEQGAGEFWMTDQQHGLIHFNGTNVTRIPWSALGRDDHATALVVDRARRGLWIGFYKGGIAFFKDGSIQASRGIADGLSAGRVAELQFDADGALWAGTAAGLSRITDKGIATLTTRNGLPCESVHWMLADREGSRWLLTSCGLARITSAELAAWVADPNRSVKSTMLDSSDGVRSQATPIGFTPTAAWLADGRLWFATPNGVGVVNPRQLPVNTLPPPVHIEQVVADRTTYDMAIDADGSVRLPPLVHELQIDYTALSLTAPEKVRFRYKLDDVDRDWQDVGKRRQAFYTDLGPGRYRFRVVAANNSGVWNETGATVDFTIAPAYYQTTWFLALSAGTVLAIVWAAHRVRLRIVETHRREVSALNERLMKAQEQERIRIAGELHDGVMQEMLAVTMMLGTAKRKVADDSDAKATIDKAQQKLIRVGTDLRQLSHDLHPPVLQEAGLPKAVQTYCEQFSTTSGIPVSCDADERACDLSRGAALALFRILQEALGNAAKHGHAKRITVGLTRSGDVVALAVSDDGAGFDPARLGVSGGLGLIMMRERASQLNGRFEFESAPGRGTTIRVMIPFR